MTKKQHIIPQHLLKGFTNSDGKTLWVANLEDPSNIRIYRSSAKDAFEEDTYYDMDPDTLYSLGGNGAKALEERSRKKYGKNYGDLSPEEKKAWFLLCLMKRMGVSTVLSPLLRPLGQKKGGTLDEGHKEKMGLL